MGCFITVFTPTYNRADKLTKLYESLCKQSFEDFEWLIVDDGSNDNTDKLIETYLKEGKINIRYFYKENRGKHVALNYGAQHAEGDWFFCVDSDDYLTDNALQILYERLKDVEDKPLFAGVAGLRGKNDGTAWKTWEYEKNKEIEEYLDDFIDADAITYRYKMKLRGDRAEVLKTSLLKEYPFPQFENEKFVSENYLWLSLANEGYIFRWFNDIIYVTEYLETGLTKNIKDNYKKNPCGRCYVDNLMVSCKSLPIQEKIRASVNYYRYGMGGNIPLKQLLRESNSKVLSIVSIPIAMLKRV